MHTITKEFDFCYGHRVWSQELNAALSIDNKCVCRHLHGHQGKIIITLSANELQRGMVTDFKHLNWFKQFVDDVIDHKFIIDIHDPAYSILIPLPESLLIDTDKRGKSNRIKMEHGYEIIDLYLYKDYPRHILEILEGFIIVNFVPTSENISRWIHQIVSKKMDPYGIEVSSVEFKETPKTSATYIQPGTI